MKNVVIVGGGSIGLFSAYYLQKKGFQVTVADKHNFTDGCSFGNAGLIVPSHIVPMASPGYVRTGIKKLFDPNALFSIKLPPSVDLINWLMRFYFAATKKHVERSIPALKEILLLSQSLFNELYNSNEIGFNLNQKGLLMLYKTKKMEHEEIGAALIANKNGMKAEILSLSDIRKMEENISSEVLGGVYYPDDNHVDSQQLMNALINYLKENGVKLVENFNVKEIRRSGRTGSELIAENETIKFDQLIIAAGTWSAELLKTLGVKILLQPGKGYSFKINTDKKIAYPALLSEAKVAVSPTYNGTIRFSGGMEIGNFNSKIVDSQLLKIKQSITEYYPGVTDFQLDVHSTWQGPRPCSFDGLPYIGKASGFDNIYIGTGHSMLGITLGPATGFLLSELINNEAPSLDLKPFLPSR